jgi:hypothetical protein
MAATLTPVAVSRAGDNFTANAVAATGGGDSWANTGSEIFVINNGGGSPITLTLVDGPGGTIDGQVLPNRTVSVLAAKTFVIGPFQTNIYNDANGLMNVTYSAVTSVTVRVYRLTPNA